MSNPNTKGDNDRRGFLVRALRAAGIACVGVMGGSLAGRWLTRGPDDEVCDYRQNCRQCPVLGGCQLPRGISARNVLGVRRDG